MVFRGGHWYLVGHDVGRDDIRAFRLSRFTSDLDDVGEGIEPPEGFRATDHVEAGPWAATAEEHAEVAFAPEVAWWATASFAGAREVSVDDDGWVTVSVPMADPGCWPHSCCSSAPTRRSGLPRPCAARSCAGWRASVSERSANGLPEDRRAARADARDRAVPGPPPRIRPAGRRPMVRRAARSAAPRSRPAVHVGAAALRAGRPDRCRRRRGRADLDHDGRSLLPAAAPDPERGAAPCRSEAPSCSPRPGCPRPPRSRARCGSSAKRLAPRWPGPTIAIATAEAGRPPAHLETLRRAAGDHERLTIEYFAGSTAEWTTRDVEPEEVFSAMGNWYVAAWDVAADDERLFRADRIRAATPTGARFEPRGLAGAGRALCSRRRVTRCPCGCRLRPGARWIAEYYVTDDAEEHDDGSIEVTLPAARLGWVAGLLLRVGDDAEVLAPPEARRGRSRSSPLERSHATAECRAERTGGPSEAPPGRMTRVG